MVGVAAGAGGTAIATAMTEGMVGVAAAEAAAAATATETRVTCFSLYMSMAVLADQISFAHAFISNRDGTAIATVMTEGMVAAAAAAAATATDRIT